MVYRMSKAMYEDLKLQCRKDDMSVTQYVNATFGLCVKIKRVVTF